MDKPQKCTNVVIDTGYSSDERDTLLSQSLYAPNVLNIYDQPRDYRIAIILSAIFCFVPLGILGMYFSSRVKMFFRKGYHTKAAKMSAKTKLVLQLTLLVGSGLWLTGILVLIHALTNH